MAVYYYATITYLSGEKVRVVHKGKVPTKGTMALLAPIAACIEVGEEVPPEVARTAEVAAAGIAGVRRLGANAQFDTPEPDDD